MAKWATEPWETSIDETNNKIIARIKRVADIIRSDAVCKSRPTVRDKADELLSLISILERRINK
tara:strand:- start:551 stop:742 length:192 start_codon:yes stop_codon:yes gene_type:complete